MEITNMVLTDSTPEKGRAVTADELIASLVPPVSEESREYIKEVIDAESSQAAAAFRTNQHEKLEQAKAEERRERSRAEEQRKRLEAAESDLDAKEADRGSYAKAAIFIACAVTCFISEFVLTWVTLPFILNQKQSSFLGVMLGIAPATAVIILDIVLLRLIEDPWQKAKAALSAMGRRARWILMAAFLIAIASINIYTVVLLAEGREEASKARRNVERIEGDEEIAVDMEAINRAILAVSVTVTLDGALFFLLGLQDSRRLAELWKSRLDVKRLRSEQDKLEAIHGRAAALLAVTEEQWRQIDDRLGEIARQYRARHLFKLTQVANRPLRSATGQEAVNEILARAVSAKTESGQGNRPRPQAAA